MNAWQTITSDPLRFLVSAWPWRALLYLLTGLPGGLAWIVIVVNGRQAGMVTASAVLLVAACVLSRPIAALERRRLRLVDPEGLPPPPARAGLASPATWREIGHALLWATLLPTANGTIFVLVGLTVHSYVLALPAVLSPLFVVATAAGCAYLFTVLAVAQAALARSLLAAPEEESLVELTRSRARLVDAFQAERRRIERDLHDGAQHRLTAVLMHLGLARLDVEEDPVRTAQAIGLAYEHVQAAQEELRRVIRGIHPSALTDRGLCAALTDLARHCPLPVVLDLDVPRRPSAGVEAAAYFCVAESLTNAVRHSGAGRVTITARESGGLLVVEVGDDGVGGADPAAGSGLAGLADRLAVFDGTLSFSSPRGGPTVVRVELPCA
ncbi:sensor histidine kinase [Nonomuraea longicatena]|uniref:histidine kinase n=1 Tax=Nonomuraea longicatena TaxID=83682 RepID=A0ABP4AZ52_9ACTN